MAGQPDHSFCAKLSITLETVLTVASTPRILCFSKMSGEGEGPTNTYDFNSYCMSGLDIFRMDGYFFIKIAAASSIVARAKVFISGTAKASCIYTNDGSYKYAV